MAKYDPLVQAALQVVRVHEAEWGQRGTRWPTLGTLRKCPDDVLQPCEECLEEAVGKLEAALAELGEL